MQLKKGQLLPPCPRCGGAMQKHEGAALAKEDSDCARGSGQTARQLFDFHFDIIPDDPHGKTLHSFPSWRRAHGTRLDVEMRTVPRANHFFAYEHAFRQRPATMGTGIVDRVVGRPYGEDGEATPAHVHKLPAFRVFEVRHRSNPYKLTHDNLLSYFS